MAYITEHTNSFSAVISAAWGTFAHAISTFFADVYRASARSEAIQELHKEKTEKGAFGINIIVNKSNLKYKEQLKVCCDEGVDFIITSLGNPKEIIEAAHRKGIKVFCDVVKCDLSMSLSVVGVKRP